MPKKCDIIGKFDYSIELSTPKLGKISRLQTKYTHTQKNISNMLAIFMQSIAMSK